MADRGSGCGIKIHRGHVLGIEEIHPARISNLSATDMIGRTVLLYESVDSSNTAGSRLARNAMPEGTVVIASSQTAGRGRKGRSWYADPSDSLTFSIILRPAGRCENLTLILAISVIEVISELAVEASMKWPNDVWIGDRKAGGILAEMRNAVLVLGMGLNVNNDPDAFPGSLRDSAVSLKTAAGRSLDRGIVLSRILEGFENHYRVWQGDGFAAFRERAEDMLVWKDERVLLESSEGDFSGKLIGIDEEGYLLLETCSGIKVFGSGDLRPSPA
jgi:BirA family biotin operon repressor/biotin-[acetyl-CoA-carboxylase] ligase